MHKAELLHNLFTAQRRYGDSRWTKRHVRNEVSECPYYYTAVWPRNLLREPAHTLAWKGWSSNTRQGTSDTTVRLRASRPVNTVNHAASLISQTRLIGTGAPVSGVLKRWDGQRWFGGEVDVRISEDSPFFRTGPWYLDGGGCWRVGLVYEETRNCSLSGLRNSMWIVWNRQA